MSAKKDRFKKVLVVGGGGYVGAVLAPQLVNEGFAVRVFDLFLYGKDVFNGAGGKLELVQGDVRDQKAVAKALEGCDAVIHLACISNDPSFELDPELGKAINYTAFEPMVLEAKRQGIQRFIFASTSSVYGVSDDPDITETHDLKPLTDYSKYKAMCEEVLARHRSKDFVCVILRPATVCGFSPRLRLDLTVNILTSHAVQKGRITVLGGAQKRPNIHIADICDLYVKMLRYPDDQIRDETFNAGYQNHTVSDIAQIVRKVVESRMPGKKVEVVTAPSNDNRSYHISSAKIAKALGFVPRRTIEDAVSDLVEAFKAGKIPDPDDVRYFNIKTMQAVRLK